MPESFDLGGSADFSLAVAKHGELTRVDVIATDASQLKAAYLELHYDASQYSVVGAEATGLLAGVTEAALIQLQVTTTAGTVVSGQLLARPQEQRGFSGTGAVQTFWLTARPTPRTVASPPQTDFSVTQLTLQGKTLRWHFNSQGDYDQNGIVTISDITPLGIHYTEKVAPAQFDYLDVRSVIDGDSNGEIFISDITPIGVNYDNTVVGYSIFGSSNLDDYPAANDGEDSADALETVAVLDGAGTVNERREYEYQLITPVAGRHYWVRPTDGTVTGTPSNSVQYFPSNASPIADLVADVTTGGDPLLVNFDASGSSDPDGTIVKYEFDWDGSGGQPYVDNGINPQASHTFVGGTHTVNLRVTDNLGATALDQVTINAVQLSAPPIAVVNADILSGPAPLTVTFDASFSSDDVAVAKYEWDFDGDGTYDLDSGLISNAVHTYLAGGVFSAVVRVIDADDQTATDTLEITVGGGTGEPVAVLEADVVVGAAPLMVNFDGSGSFDTDGGTVDNYEWDWEGDSSIDLDTGSVSTASHLYDVPGVYAAKLRVTDNDGKTALAQINIRAYDPLDLGAHAIVFADVRYGPAPHVVNFDASESYSTNGAITKYEWDWNGDGVFDEDSGTDSTVQHTFSSPATIDTVVRVTDVLTMTDTETLLILITPDDTFPPDDSIFILPVKSTAADGEVVRIEMYAKNTAEELQFVVGRITMPSGNKYAQDSWQAGDLRGGQQSVDGLWQLMSPPPSGFLALFFEDDPGGGTMTIDLAVAPLNTTELAGASGAICNLGIEVHNDITFGLVRSDSTDRTYYQGSDLANRFWAVDDNLGLPGIDMQ